MRNTGISLPERMIEEIDDRRHANTPRSQWIGEAIQARLDAEDDGTWEDVELAEPADA